MTNPNYYNGYPGYDPGMHERKKRAKWVGLGIGAVATSVAAGTILYLSSPEARATINPPEESSTSSEYNGAIDNPSADAESTEEQEAPQLENEYPPLTKEAAQIDLSESTSITEAPSEFVEVMSEGLTAGATNENLTAWLDLDEARRATFIAAIADQSIQSIAGGAFGANAETTYENSQDFLDSLKPYYVYGLTKTFEREERNAYTQYQAEFTYIDTENEENLDKGPILNSTIKIRFSDNGDYVGSDALTLEFDANAWAVKQEQDDIGNTSDTVVYTLPQEGATARFDKASQLTPASEEEPEVPAV